MDMSLGISLEKSRHDHAAEGVDAVQLIGVSKTYRMGKTDVPALQGIDLAINRENFTFLIGPSGSGKTTLLNLIGCIDRPSQGEINIMGSPVARLSDNEVSDFRNRHIGYIFQSFNLIEVLSVFENVEYPLILQKMPATQRSEIVGEILNAVGLWDRREHWPEQLSGGQRQRVAIARALAKRPDLVLADEPTANLDSRTSHDIIELMLKMQQQYRTTFIFSTHDRDVMGYADNVIALKDGSIESTGTQSW
jgi:putative ABC transport system ATP-binding protein